jgi:anaerobic selenocysteine-containing dehydrogenase
MAGEVVFRTCTLCEAGCGLAFEVDGGRVLSARPDHNDPFSKGYVCPKGIALPALHHDPDRLRQPLRRTGPDTFEPIGWDEAIALAGERFRTIREEHGGDALAVYLGNPIVHNHGALLLRKGLLRALGTRNSYSASSQDTAPRFAASHFLYGNNLSIPIPDVDRTDYLLCVGANPLVSNGSFLTAPDMRGRLKRIRERGGRVVVVDPRRSETAEHADEHVSIRPGTDAAFLFAVAGEIVAAGSYDRAFLERECAGWETIEPLLARFTPESVAAFTGVNAGTTRRIAREFGAATKAVCYSRVGVCNTRHGTLACFATDVLNLVCGRLGAEGGALFSTPALDLPALASRLGGTGYGRWRSRVRGLPETAGDLPAAALAEEIETPGQAQVRGFLCWAGNPVLSTPDGPRLARALGRLDFMVSIDFYLNETSRHADLVLPPAGPLADEHVELFFSSFAVRNVARVSPPVVDREPGEQFDWEILLALARELGGGPTGIRGLDWLWNLGARLGRDWTPRATLALAYRFGPHGLKLRPFGRGLTLKRVAASSHGLDLGGLETGHRRRVFHRDKRVHLDGRPILDAMRALGEEIATPPPADELLLVGRRQLRTSNTWMHNVPAMVSGRERCVLLVNPEDAARAGIHADGEALLESRVHTGPVHVRLTDEIRAGVVSLPHGWGHAAAAPWQKVAGAHPGVSANDWTDSTVVESVVGQSVLNGVPVRLRPLTNVPHLEPSNDPNSLPSNLPSNHR